LASVKPSSSAFPAKSQDITPTDIDKLLKLANPKEKAAGITFQKSLDASKDKTYPVKEVYFSRMTRIPGYHGAATMIYVGGDEPGPGVNKHQVKSLMLVEGLNPKLIVDGVYFMTFASGAIEGWKH